MEPYKRDGETIIPPPILMEMLSKTDPNTFGPDWIHPKTGSKWWHSFEEFDPVTYQWRGGSQGIGKAFTDDGTEYQINLKQDPSGERTISRLECQRWENGTGRSVVVDGTGQVLEDQISTLAGPLAVRLEGTRRVMPDATWIDRSRGWEYLVTQAGWSGKVIQGIFDAGGGTIFHEGKGATIVWDRTTEAGKGSNIDGALHQCMEHPGEMSQCCDTATYIPLTKENVGYDVLTYTYARSPDVESFLAKFGLGSSPTTS